MFLELGKHIQVLREVTGWAAAGAQGLLLSFPCGGGEVGGGLWHVPNTRAVLGLWLIGN